MTLREKDIRPADLLSEYLRLNAEDGQRLLQDGRQLESRSCPGCGGDDPIPAFDKNGFSLVHCAHCKSLYVNPVPSTESLSAFYRDSPSSQYWAKVFFPAVAEARRGPIYRPRAERVASIASGNGINTGYVVDVGAGDGLFLEEFRQIRPDMRFGAVEPGEAHIATLRDKGFDVFEGFSVQAVSDPTWKGAADLVTCFEVLEHVKDPAGLLMELAGLVRPGGLLVISGLSGSGFDIQVLGEYSKAVSPPHHLTFLTTSAAAMLVEKCGLENLEISTPGELDMDIVRNVARDNPDCLNNAFLRNLVLDASDEARSQFQSFLKLACLSSHMWIVARRADVE